ncbi:hypothetical protein AB0877_08045 [Micromonospora sp. NPDC047644]|uniref:hypothetical protein n=1 Tax=Micromonospora sp. NPDC047644 TaxID=3157203 RepID=UPI00345692A9
MPPDSPSGRGIADQWVRWLTGIFATPDSPGIPDTPEFRIQAAEQCSAILHFLSRHNRHSTHIDDRNCKIGAVFSRELGDRGWGSRVAGDLGHHVLGDRPVADLGGRDALGPQQDPGRVGGVVRQKVRARRVDQVRGAVLDRQPSPPVPSDRQLVAGDPLRPVAQLRGGGDLHQLDDRRPERRPVMVVSVAHLDGQLGGLIKQGTDHPIVTGTDSFSRGHCATLTRGTGWWLR